MPPNDRFRLDDQTIKSSQTTIVISGFHLHLYGVKELNEVQAKNTSVLFHVHGRTCTYKDAEEIAHHILSAWRSHGSVEKGLVVATFDNRNHGSRRVSRLPRILPLLGYD